MSSSYYFSQGRLIETILNTDTNANTNPNTYTNTNPYSKYVDKNDNKEAVKAENKNINAHWMKIFEGYKFQIFSPSILRYK